MLSYGDGIEREIVYQLFLEFTRGQSRAKWLMEQADGMHTLQILMANSTSRHISQGRKADLQVFGAVTALMIIEGQTPEPIDPCVLQYVTNTEFMRFRYFTGTRNQLQWR